MSANPPKVVVLDISEESHETIVECIDDEDYAVQRYGGDHENYAIYKLIGDT
jgi:hypothetical protein